MNGSVGERGKKKKRVQTKKKKERGEEEKKKVGVDRGEGGIKMK